MTSSESDNVEQAVDGAFRSAVTQAAALGRMVAQLREQQQQRATRQEEAMTAELQRRYDAERQYASVMLSQADHDGWWNTASTQRVASVVATAQAWKDRDPEIAKLASRVDSRIQARWGIKPSARIDALSPEQRRHEAEQLIAALAVDELDTGDPLRQHVAEIQESASQEAQQQDQQEPVETVEEHQPLVSAEDAPHSTVQEREETTSSSREQTLDEFEQLLRSNGMDEQAIEAHMLPERANKQPASEAMNVKSPTKARPGHGGLSQDRQRDTERGR